MDRSILLNFAGNADVIRSVPRIEAQVFRNGLQTLTTSSSVQHEVGELWLSLPGHNRSAVYAELVGPQLARLSEMRNEQLFRLIRVLAGGG